MKRYSLKISEQAYKDVENLQFSIVNLFKSPLTAHRHVQGIIAEINSLRISAESYPISSQESILLYGYNARRRNYKKMAIIYTVHGDLVIIRRVLFSQMIVR